MSVLDELHGKWTKEKLLISREVGVRGAVAIEKELLLGFRTHTLHIFYRSLQVCWLQFLISASFVFKHYYGKWKIRLYKL